MPSLIRLWVTRRKTLFAYQVSFSSFSHIQETKTTVPSDVDNEYKFLSYIPCPGATGGQAKDGRYECIGQALVRTYSCYISPKQQVLTPVNLEGMDRLTCKYVPTDTTAKDAPTDISKPDTASFSTGIQVASGEKSRDFWFYGFDIGAGLF